MPTSFSRREVYRPSLADFLELVRSPPPMVIRDAILHYLPITLDLTPEAILGKFLEKQIPPFILNYFKECQPSANRRTTENTRVHRAIHLIQGYRTDLLLMSEQGSNLSWNRRVHSSLPPVISSVPHSLFSSETSSSVPPSPITQDQVLATVGLVRTSSTTSSTASSPATPASQAKPDEQE